MSIDQRTRILCLIALVLTVILVGAAGIGGLAVQRSNASVASAMTLLERHESTDDIVRQLRSDLGRATRTVGNGGRVAPETWRALDRQLKAVEAVAGGPARQGDGAPAPVLQVAATGRALVAAGEARTITLPTISAFAGSLRVFEQVRDRQAHALAARVSHHVRRSADITRLWNLVLVTGGVLVLLLQAGFSLWLRRGVSAPIRRLADILSQDKVESPLQSDLARPDEIGTLARATLAHRLDAAERAEAAGKLQHALRHDALTGLLGRQAFDEALAAHLHAAPDEPLALFTLDLDRFKDINDSNGHAGGDRVLKAVADVLRAACTDGEVVGRLGGDEFAVIQPRSTAPRAARELASRMLSAFNGEGIGLSIGVAMYPRDATEEVRLRHYSDLALYRAKHEGRGRVRFFGTGRIQSTSGATGYIPMPSELGAAIAAGELRLHYQPKIRARTGLVDSLEALVRWQHPVRGLVAPDSFIPVAERMGQIRALTEWTLERSIADQARLAEEGRDLPVYVNLSACLLGDTSFARSALDILKGRVGQVGLEITETGIIDDPDHALLHLQDFVDAGLRIAIDDYGSGMSSLSYLKRLPAHELKIDRAFVGELSRSHRDPLIVRSTIDLAHALGLEVTAEGVEKLSSFALLRAMGCDLIQGYLVARPMPLGELSYFLGDGSALAAFSSAEMDVRAAKNW